MADTADQELKRTLYLGIEPEKASEKELIGK